MKGTLVRRERVALHPLAVHAFADFGVGRRRDDVRLHAAAEHANAAASSSERQVGALGHVARRLAVLGAVVHGYRRRSRRVQMRLMAAPGTDAVKQVGRSRDHVAPVREAGPKHAVRSCSISYVFDELLEEADVVQILLRRVPAARGRTNDNTKHTCSDAMAAARVQNGSLFCVKEGVTVVCAA